MRPFGMKWFFSYEFVAGDMYMNCLLSIWIVYYLSNESMETVTSVDITVLPASIVWSGGWLHIFVDR